MSKNSKKRNIVIPLYVDSSQSMSNEGWNDSIQEIKELCEQLDEVSSEDHEELPNE